MLRAIRQFGDLLDRWDVGGWLLLIGGMAVLSVTLLAPAWMDLRRLDAQTLVLSRQAQYLQKQHENYGEFIQAVEAGDPLLIQRLAWHHLRLKPAEARVAGDIKPLDAAPAPSIDQWTRPNIPPISPAALEEAMPDSRLVRLVMGPSRPWVFAFGGWMMLMGLLINPSASKLDEFARPVKVKMPEPETPTETPRLAS